MPSPQRGRQPASPEQVQFPSVGAPAAPVSAPAAARAEPARPGSGAAGPSAAAVQSPPPAAPSAAAVYDAMEKEQEAIVNRLQREITSLKDDRTRSRSRSSSHSSSHSSSTVSVRAPSERRPRPSLGEQDSTQGLRRENDLLRRKVAELTIRLAERDLELDELRRPQREREGSHASEHS